VLGLDVSRRTVRLDNGTELPYELYLGVPRHCPPQVLQDCGMTVDGWIPVEPRTLETKFENVYAVGDIAATGTPKAGLFAECAARAVAHTLLSRIRGESGKGVYSGAGTCYIEFGGGRLSRTTGATASREESLRLQSPCALVRIVMTWEPSRATRSANDK